MPGSSPRTRQASSAGSCENPGDCADPVTALIAVRADRRHKTVTFATLNIRSVRRVPTMKALRPRRRHGCRTQAARSRYRPARWQGPSGHGCLPEVRQESTQNVTNCPAAAANRPLCIHSAVARSESMRWFNDGAYDDPTSCVRLLGRRGHPSVPERSLHHGLSSADEHSFGSGR